MDINDVRKVLNNFQYTVYDKIGEGGGGVVYVAHDRRSGFLVAVKILYRGHFKKEYFKKRFKEEANRYLNLEHKNIVALRDFVVTDDAYFLMMEFIDGYTLEQYIANVTGPIPETKTIRLITQVLDALQYSHFHNTIHLDIKPANIMVSKADNFNTVKILDFGISITKEEQDSEIKFGGTPMYMSPEQTEGKNVDLRSDIYSLGVTMHQMLTAKLPYKGFNSMHELYNWIKTKPLPRVKEHYPVVSDRVQSAIDKATQKEKSARFQSCAEFAHALK